MVGTCPLCHEGVFGFTDGIRSYYNGRNGAWTHWSCILDESRRLDHPQLHRVTAKSVIGIEVADQ